MAIGYISGQTMLRPIRMGLVMPAGSLDSLQRAVELATSTWGGQSFPIFETTGNNQEILRQSVAMGVDCLFPVGDDEESVKAAETPGFKWSASFDRLSPFNRGNDTHGEHLLPVSSLYDWYRLNRLPSVPTYSIGWESDHELDDLLTVWFGRFGQDQEQIADGQAFAGIAQPCPLGIGMFLPPRPMSMQNQLSVTMQDVLHRHRWHRQGVVVLDSKDTAQLTTFWNLRASGQDVFPWIESSAELLESSLMTWISDIAEATQASADHPIDFSLWLPNPAVMPERLKSLETDDRFRLMIDSHRLDLHNCGPIFTTHERHFAVDVDPSRGDAAIPVPPLDFLPRRSSWTNLGMVAADIDIWTESNLGNGARATVPAARCIAPHIRDRWNSLVPFARPRSRGRVVPMKVSEETTRLTFVGADLLTQRLAKDAGYKLTLTENGRRVHHRMALFGGITEDSLANQPAVREVVRDALRSPYGVKVRALWETARQHDAGWSDHIWFVRRSYKDYPAAVVGTLANRGILQPLADLQCPNCASAIRVPPSALGEPLLCELCSASISFSTYLANHPEKPATWDMRAMPALDSKHFNEMIPIMATLSVFAAAFEFGHSDSAPLNVVGIELKNASMECEIDFMVLVQDAELPAVIIGEAKAGHPDNPKPGDLLTEDDLNHLEAVQDAIRRVGIDCWIAFATTRPSLQQSEIDLLKRACDRSLMPVHDFQGLLLPMLPIVFTGEDLSVPAMADQHPARRVHGSFPRLPALGKDSCQRYLGLVDIDFGPAADGHWQAKPRW
jgi:hypothetical protein